MSITRYFSRSGYQHVYQISIDGSILFCTIADRILLFTLISVKAILYGVTITHICIMYNHFHIQAKFPSTKIMDEFMSSVTWTFAMLYNNRFGLKGHVFHKPFGSAPKVKPQKIKENMFYISANPVVKKAVGKAWDYRWNFLRYGPSMPKNPFSEEINPITMSGELKTLMKEVQEKRNDLAYIDYRFFGSKKYLSLSRIEQRQLVDYIISVFNIIDYSPIIGKYGSVEAYCRVVDEIEGNDFELNDDADTEDYTHYDKMIQIAAEEGYDLRYKRYDIGTIPEKLYRDLCMRFRNEAVATDIEIRKFFKKSTSDSTNGRVRQGISRKTGL